MHWPRYIGLHEAQALKLQVYATHYHLLQAGDNASPLHTTLHAARAKCPAHIYASHNGGRKAAGVHKMPPSQLSARGRRMKSSPRPPYIIKTDEHAAQRPPVLDRRATRFSSFPKQHRNTAGTESAQMNRKMPPTTRHVRLPHESKSTKFQVPRISPAARRRYQRLTECPGSASVTALPRPAT